MQNERREFTIDVGTMTKGQEVAFIERLKTELLKRSVPEQ